MFPIFDLSPEAVDIDRQGMPVHKLAPAVPQPVQQYAISQELSLMGKKFLQDPEFRRCHRAGLSIHFRFMSSIGHFNCC